MSEFSQLTDDALIAEVVRLGNLVSYFEAAEGEAYRREAKDRMAAKVQFYAAVAVAGERGLKTPGGFLL